VEIISTKGIKENLESSVEIFPQGSKNSQGIRRMERLRRRKILKKGIPKGTNCLVVGCLPPKTLKRELSSIRKLTKVILTLEVWE